MRQVQIDALIWREGNAFVSQCLNVEVASYGDSAEEAAASLKEAVELYLEDVPETDVGRILSNVRADIPLPSKDTVKRKIPLDIDC